MTFDPTSVEVTCVTLPKDNCVQVPWEYINVCGSGLISKVVKTYFDRKAVKTRLKPVKTGLNRSKHGQNLELMNTCQGL